MGKIISQFFLLLGAILLTGLLAFAVSACSVSAGGGDDDDDNDTSLADDDDVTSGDDDGDIAADHLAPGLAEHTNLSQANDLPLGLPSRWGP